MLRNQRSLHWLLVIGSTIALSLFAAFTVWYGSPGLESIAAISSGDTSDQTQIYLKQDGSRVQGKGAEVFGNRIEITKGGSYVLTGTLEDGQIHAAAGEDETVTLILAGADITSTSKEAIRIEATGQAELVLKEGTENRVRSGEKRSVTEDTEEASEGKGAIYADCDLDIRGTGSLQILGYLNNGIHVTENLVIQNGVFQIEAVNHGIKGKSSVTIQDGEFTIVSGKDGIKSDRDTKEEYGRISLEGGSFQIESQGDGVQAETVLEVTGGTYRVTAGGGSENASKEQKEGENPPEAPGGEMPKEGENPPEAPGGEMPKEGGEAPEFREEPPELGENPDQQHPDNDPFNRENPRDFQGRTEPEDQAEEEETSVSTKGFKCKTQMNISGGSFSVDTEDDAFHSDGNIQITGGSLEITTGDDGIHANEELTVEGGAIRIDKCYEGLEANQILIQDGEIAIKSSDDGVNAYGGSSGFGMQESAKTTEEMPNFRMTGGSLTINAEGDGLDSNGNISIEGGEIIVDGPSNDGNGAIDSGSENGGTCKISGGTVLAVGCSGMAETFSEASRQYSFCCNLSESFEAGEEIKIIDSEGELLYGHKADKSGNSIVFSSPELTEGETYTLYAGEQSVSIPLDSVSTISGQQGGFHGGPGGDPGMFSGNREDGEHRGGRKRE